MTSKNNDFPYSILDDGQYIFYFPNFNMELRKDKNLRTRTSSYDSSLQTYLVFDDIAYEGIYIDDDGCLCYVIPFCKHCNSRNVIRKDYNPRELVIDNGQVLNAKMKRYLCKDCYKKSQTELIGLYEPYARISTNIKLLFGKSLGNGYKSLRQQAADLELYTDCTVSHESIRKALLTDGEFYYINNFVKLSGYCSYDAQYVHIERKRYYRLVLFDIVDNMPIAESIVKKETNNVIYDFINKSLPDHKRTAIITDSKNGYSTVMKKLGFKNHQHCTFHLQKRITDLIISEIKKQVNEYKKEIKEKNPKISNNQLDIKLDKKSKELWDYYQVYIDDFGSIFKQETRNDAIAKINEIRKNIHIYPDFIAKYLNKNFFPQYAKYIVFLKENVKNHLE